LRGYPLGKSGRPLRGRWAGGIAPPAQPQQSVPVRDGSPLPTYALDGDEMAADTDDGDAGHTWRSYMVLPT
jgi:hypothetical protein